MVRLPYTELLKEDIVEVYIVVLACVHNNVLA
jgi:hypothetical protein